MTFDYSKYFDIIFSFPNRYSFSILIGFLTFNCNLINITNLIINLDLEIYNIIIFTVHINGKMETYFKTIYIS